MMRLATLVAAALAACVSPQRDDAPGGAFTLRTAWLAPAAAGQDAALFLTIDNFGALPLHVTSISSPSAERVVALAPPGGDSSTAIVIPPGTVMAVEPGRARIVLRNLRHALAPGDQVAVLLHCGTTMRLRVVAVVREPFPLRRA
jgi:copper(I)-binding protein